MIFLLLGLSLPIGVMMGLLRFGLLGRRLLLLVRVLLIFLELACSLGMLLLGLLLLFLSLIGVDKGRVDLIVLLIIV